MSGDRWYAAKTTRPPHRLLNQPQGGFADVGEVMKWLEQKGLLRRVVVDGESWLEGWGSDYCAVAGSRNDPWEPRPQLRLAGG